MNGSQSLQCGAVFTECEYHFLREVNTSFIKKYAAFGGVDTRG